MSFHFSYSHSHTTVGHVITLMWSLWNQFHSCLLTSPHLEVVSCSVSLQFNHTYCLDKWQRVCVFLCQEAVIGSYNRSCPFSFLFLQQFNSMLSTNTSTFDTTRTPIPVPLLPNVVLHLDIFTWYFNWLNVITNWGQIRVHKFRWTFERTGC